MTVQGQKGGVFGLRGGRVDEVVNRFSFHEVHFPVVKGAGREFPRGRVSHAARKIGFDDLAHDDHRAMTANFDNILSRHGMGAGIGKEDDLIDRGPLEREGARDNGTLLQRGYRAREKAIRDGENAFAR